MKLTLVLSISFIIFGMAAAQSGEENERSRESIERTRKRVPFGGASGEVEHRRHSVEVEEKQLQEQKPQLRSAENEEEEEGKKLRSRRGVESVGKSGHVEHEPIMHGLSEGREESIGGGRVRGEERKQSYGKERKPMPPLGEKTRKEIGHEKKEHVFFEKAIDYFMKNPRTERDRQCFEKYLKPGVSIDFVVDVAPSPSNDEIDKLCANSPIALFLERSYRTPSRAYFGAIQFFIDAVTIGMKPELTHSVIVDKTGKFYIRGRGVDQCEAIDRLTSKGEFMDTGRNLKTLWPVCTKEVVSKLEPIVENNLGRMTKLALWNRDNGLASVLASSRRSKAGLIFVITDGASGLKINELTEDLSRTIVFDIGNHRFVDRLSWDEVRRIVSTYTLTAPQQLPLMLDTARSMACRLLEQQGKEQQQSVSKVPENVM